MGIFFLRRPKLFLQARSFGLVNRFEGLNLAFLIQKTFGHAVVLDWPELAELAIDGTECGAPGHGDKIGAVRIGNETENPFPEWGQSRRILLRTYQGPAELLDAEFAATLRRISLEAAAAQQVRAVLATAGRRPLVGVHIRRGDFAPAGEAYAQTASRHPAVPLWWYRETMERIRAVHPDVIFYVSLSGGGAEMAALASEFDVLQGQPASYAPMHAGHVAATSPVLDLFTLACCSLVIGTPLSSFSYYASSILGECAPLLLPPSEASPGEMCLRVVDRRSEPRLRWPVFSPAFQVGSHFMEERETGTLHVGPAQTDWLTSAGGAGALE